MVDIVDDLFKEKNLVLFDEDDIVFFKIYVSVYVFFFCSFCVICCKFGFVLRIFSVVLM